jgi:hypothetical protein
VEANERNNGGVEFSVVSASLVATQRCGKHMSATVNQHATIEEAVFFVGPLRGYIRDLRQLELEPVWRRGRIPPS